MSARTTAILGIISTLAVIYIESPVALAIVLMEGTVAFAVLGAAALAGLWVLHFLGLRSLSWLDRIIFGAALGIGTLSLLVLMLGSASILTRPLAIILIVILAIAGIGYIARMGGIPARRDQGGTVTAFNWLWLAIIPFFVIMLLASSLPPGVLW